MSIRNSGSLKRNISNRIVLNKLDSLEKEDPKSYWRLVNMLKEDQHVQKNSVGIDTWSDH